MGSNPTQGSFFFEKRESCPGCTSLPLLACHESRSCVYVWRSGCTCTSIQCCLPGQLSWLSSNPDIQGKADKHVNTNSVRQGKAIQVDGVCKILELPWTGFESAATRFLDWHSIIFELHVHVYTKTAPEVHDKQSKANIYTHDSFLLFQRRNCPGWDSNPRHSVF